MTMQNETLFESPAAHEASHYSNPYSNPEEEWETPESSPYSNPYSNPEEEWETPEASPYSNPYSNPEEEWETPEASPYSNPYSNPEEEWETPDRFLGGIVNAVSSLLGEEETAEGESEWEADPFIGKAFKRLKRGLGSIASKAFPIAKLLAPIAAKAIGGLIPGAGPLIGGVLNQVMKEAEMEVAQFENHFFNAFSNPEGVPETAQNEAIHEAALAELMAAEAVSAESESEAEAVLSGTLPITITIMGARRPLRRVMPVLAQANGRLVRVLGSRGTAGRQLLRLVPTIQRRAVATLRAAARNGQPITPPLAVRAMSNAAGSVLSNPRLVQRAIRRNAALRIRVSPINPRRGVIYAPNAIRLTANPNFRRPAGASRRVIY